MSEQSRASGQEANSGGDRPAARKPYSKPEFRYERVFETMALACSKVSITQFTCKINRKKS
jgi:hypothetical protein